MQLAPGCPDDPVTVAPPEPLQWSEESHLCVAPVASCEPEGLPPFFVIFLFREAAAAAVAETKQLEHVAVARAVMAKIENFMVIGRNTFYMQHPHDSHDSRNESKVTIIISNMVF